MAEIHKKGDGKETTNGDIPVVAPINMGKGIKWNANTKQYDVSIAENQPIHVNDNGDLEVRVSNLEDNLLRVIDGKLYYGTKARTELANLYVDAVNGVDQDPLKVKGAGTRANPLRTLKYAIRLAESNTQRNIFLKESQTHEYACTELTYLKTGTLNIHPYGDEVDKLSAQYKNGFITRQKLVETGKEPAIEFTGMRSGVTGETSYTVYGFDGIYVPANTYLTISGVKFINDVTAHLDTTTAGTNHLVSMYGRIRSEEDGVINIYNFNYEAKGVITFSGNHHPLMDTQAKTNGLYNVGLIYVYQGKVTLRNLLNFNADKMPAHIIAHSAWNPDKMGSMVSLNIKDSSEEARKELVKRIYGVNVGTTPNGDKYIVSPQVDLETRYFI